MINRDSKEYKDRLNTILTKLKDGISVYIERDINGIFGTWIKITKIGNNHIIGFAEQNNPLVKQTEVKFNKEDIIRVSGEVDWNINNLFVECSTEVLETKSVGYFYNSLTESPVYSGRMFYSINEINKDKTNIATESIPLKELITLDDSITPYLEEFAYYGFIKNNLGGFDELKRDFVIKQNRDVYPRAIE